MIASRTACALALLTLAPWTAAQLPEGPEFGVATGAALPEIAVAPNGDFVIVWSGPDNDQGGIFAQRFASDGAPWGEAFRVNPAPRGRQADPAVAFGPGGEMVVVWTNVCYSPPCPIRKGILARRFAADGSPAGNKFRVNLTDTGNQSYPAVAFDPDGGFLVTWSDDQYPSNDPYADPISCVLGRRFAADATPLGGELELSTTSQLGGHTTALAFAPDGSFAVAWSAYVGEGSITDVFVQVFASDATPLSDSLQVNSEDDLMGTPQNLGGLAMAASGEFVVIWDSAGQDHQDDDEGMSTGIYGRRFAADGSPLGDEFLVNTTVVGSQDSPSVAMTPDGDFLVTWTDRNGLDGDREGIFGQWFAADGTPRGSEFQINGRPWAHQMHSAVALTPDHDAIVAWTDAPSLLPHEYSVNVVARRLKAACTAGETTLCPAGGRFRVELAWADFEGHADYGTAQPLTADSGTFWFFDPDNVELVVKVLDGRGVNGHFWVFYGALTNLAYTVTVSDTETDRQKIYRNPVAQFASVGDAAAFADPVAGPGSRPVAGGWELLAPAPGAPRTWAGPGKAECPAGRLCLGPGGRFELAVAWQDFGGRTGTGMPVPLTPDSGYFWFFDPDNVEVMAKVLDGRAINGYFWVFYASLSNVEYTLTVTDVLTGAVREYVNPLGTFASAGDVRAFRPSPPDSD